MPAEVWKRPVLAIVADQCRWLCNIGFLDMDCFWKYFEWAIFGGVKRQ